MTPTERLVEFLDGDEGVWFDRFGLWASGKRDTQWLAEAAGPARAEPDTDDPMKGHSGPHGVVYVGEEPDTCPKSKRIDGDDPYVVCHWCKERRDAIGPTCQCSCRSPLG